MLERKRPVSILQLMVQTPTDLFVYWVVSREYLAIARAGLPESAAKIALLLYRQEAEQSEEAALVWLEPDQMEGSYYFSGQRPRKSYYAELALSCQGVFFTLLRSNLVATPPVAPESGESPAVHLPWPVVPLKLPFAYSPSEERRGD